MNRKNLIQKRKNSKLSTGEKIVSSYLRKAQIKFIREHNFPDLVNDKTGSPLFFDFWLPRLNLIIEVDGRQHYEAINGREDAFLDLQYRDSIKDQFCVDRRIKLLRLRYYQLKPPFTALSECLGTSIDIGKDIHKLTKKANKIAKSEDKPRPHKKNKKQRKVKLRLTDRQKRNMARAKKGERVQKNNVDWMAEIERKREEGRKNYPPDLREKFLNLRQQ